MERKKTRLKRVRNESYADYLERRAPHYRAAGSRPDHRAIQRFVASANDLPSDEETKRKRMIRDVGSARVGQVYGAAVPACNQPPGVHGAENHGNTAGSRTSAVSQLLFLLSDNSYNSFSRQQCRDFLLAFQRLYPQALFLYR